MTKTGTSRPAIPAPRPAEKLDWRAEYAYTAGVQAFIYGFPYIYNARIRHAWVTNKQDPDVVPVCRGQPVLARQAAHGRQFPGPEGVRARTRCTPLPGWT